MRRRLRGSNSTPRGSVALATIGNLAPAAAAFITAPVLAQSLGVFERGQVAAGTAPLMLAASAVTLGMPEAVTFFVARGGRARAGRMITIATIIVATSGVIVSGLFFGLATLLSGGDPAVAELIRLSIIMLAPSLVLLVFRGACAGRARWGLIAVERSIGSVFRLVCVVILGLSQSLTIVTATLAISISAWIGIVAYIALLFPRASITEPKQRPAQLLGYGSRVWFGALAGVLLSRVDQLLIAPLSNASELGLYVVAVAIAELVLVFNNAVRDVYFAEESRAPDLMRVAAAARSSTIVTLGLVVVVGIASVWMIPVLFGRDFTPALIPTLILLGAVLLGNPGSLAGAGLSALGRPHLRSVSLLLALIANVVAVFILVPQLGAVGAALATGVGNVIAASMNLIWIGRVEGRSVAWRFLMFERADLVGVGAMVNRIGKMRDR